MGQLDIAAARSVAAEREQHLTRELERRRTGAERDTHLGGTVRRARRRYGLLERLHLVHHPAR
ncbi:MAG TPA: hypothetical protein VK038_05910 [Ornithinicoccus sp.]|jgi:hypothetical protein|nr:hypothetical protein [Ornithinicoccus sp.]